MRAQRTHKRTEADGRREFLLAEKDEKERKGAGGSGRTDGRTDGRPDCVVVVVVVVIDGGWW